MTRLAARADADHGDPRADPFLDELDEALGVLGQVVEACGSR